MFLCSVHTQILQSKIWISHNGVGEDSGLLGCDTKLSSQREFLMFQRIIVPSNSGSSSPRRTAMILCNIKKYRPSDKVPHPQRPDSKYCEACLLKYKGNYWGCMTFHFLLQMFIFWDKISLANYPQKMRIDYSVTEKEKQQLKLKMKNGQKSNKGNGGCSNLHDIFTT
jgi:hypothetical protein